MSNFEDFKAAYQRLIDCGVAKECSDKELFLYYVDAEINYTSIKEQWESEKVYRYFSGVDDKPEEKK